MTVVAGTDTAAVTDAPAFPEPATVKWIPNLPAEWSVLLTDTLWDNPDRHDLAIGTSFLFANGRTWQTSVIHAQVLGAIPAAGKAPFIVISGWPCDACDATSGVWIRSPDDGPLTGEARDSVFAYPGDLQVFGDGLPNAATLKTVYSSRLFFGDCLPQSSPGATWFERTLSDDRWTSRIVTVTVEGTALRIDTLSFRQQTSDTVAARVAAGVCRELPPQNQTAL